MTPKLIQHPTLPDWLYHEYTKNDGNTLWVIRDGYRPDESQDEPLFTAQSPQRTAVSQQFVILARKWDKDHGKKHKHNKKKKVA
jgi:hypothetical protein